MTDEPPAGRFRQWMWRPPRPHGETIAERTVSVLELFYDLVYVAVVSQAADRLASHVSWRGVGEFAVVFTLIWVGWINGTLYLELHGREDGRTRTVVFAQMGVLVVLAVFTADAAAGGGRGFAIAYATFGALLTWLWYSVHRQDRRDHAEVLTLTSRYIVGIGVSTIVVLASAFLPDNGRLVVWGVVVIGWIAGWPHSDTRPSASAAGCGRPRRSSSASGRSRSSSSAKSSSVVGGLSAAEHDGASITTGIIALVIGCGLWWIYFDLVGRRPPRPDDRALAGWLLSHLPTTLSITAAGAAMVSLVEHAHDDRTPVSTAWLLAGSVALTLVAVILTIRALADAQRLANVYGPVSVAMAVGAVAAVGAGWLRPAPWLLALLLVTILSALWFYAVSRFLRADVWGDEPPRQA